MCLQWMMTSQHLCQQVIKLMMQQVLALQLQRLMFQELRLKNRFNTQRLLHNLLKMTPFTGGEWKENDSLSLAKVARVFLAIPATSAPTERAFSKHGQVCAKE